MEEGYELEWTIHKDLVDKTDQYGMAAIEGFYLGMNVFVSGIAKETKASVAALVSPYNTMGVTGSMDLGHHRRCRFGHPPRRWFFRPSPGTPARGGRPASTHGSRGHHGRERQRPNRILVRGIARRPYRLRLYPYLSSSVKYFVAS